MYQLSQIPQKTLLVINDTFMAIFKIAFFFKRFLLVYISILILLIKTLFDLNFVTLGAFVTLVIDICNHKYSSGILNASIHKGNVSLGVVDRPSARLPNPNSYGKRKNIDSRTHSNGFPVPCTIYLRKWNKISRPPQKNIFVLYEESPCPLSSRISRLEIDKLTPGTNSPLSEKRVFASNLESTRTNLPSSTNRRQNEFEASNHVGFDKPKEDVEKNLFRLRNRKTKRENYRITSYKLKKCRRLQETLEEHKKIQEIPTFDSLRKFDSGQCDVILEKGKIPLDLKPRLNGIMLMENEE